MDVPSAGEVAMQEDMTNPPAHENIPLSIKEVDIDTLEDVHVGEVLDGSCVVNVQNTEVVGVLDRGVTALAADSIHQGVQGIEASDQGLQEGVTNEHGPRTCEVNVKDPTSDVVPEQYPTDVVAQIDPALDVAANQVPKSDVVEDQGPTSGVNERRHTDGVDVSSWLISRRTRSDLPGNGIPSGSVSTLPESQHLPLAQGSLSAPQSLPPRTVHVSRASQEVSSRPAETHCTP